MNYKEAKKIFSQIDWNKTTPKKVDVLKVINQKNIKLVILGQDPYPTRGVANGRAFAVEKDTPIPASLKQIFKEIKDYEGKVKTDRTLQSWSKQGVLLLNTSLTTEIGKPNAHKSLWKGFTTSLIKKLGEDENLIWVLWGNEAKSYKRYIKSHKISEDGHPSPLSRRYRKGNWLKDIEKWTKIDW